VAAVPCIGQVELKSSQLCLCFLLQFMASGREASLP
jgi:hypothetical protein